MPSQSCLFAGCDSTMAQTEPQPICDVQDRNRRYTCLLVRMWRQLLHYILGKKWYGSWRIIDGVFKLTMMSYEIRESWCSPTKAQSLMCCWSPLEHLTCRRHQKRSPGQSSTLQSKFLLFWKYTFLKGATRMELLTLVWCAHKETANPRESCLDLGEVLGIGVACWEKMTLNGIAVNLFMTYFAMLEEMSAIWVLVT